MKIKKTGRGFEIIDFKDQHGTECSIQQSSNAMQECIWLGANKIGLKEFVAYRQPEAWVDKNEVDETTEQHHFIANNRMHLTRKQVAKLLPYLQNFVETGLLYNSTTQLNNGMKKEDYKKTTDAVLAEVVRAKGMFPADFVNQHEGYAVILEELDELWDEVKKNQRNYDLDAQRKEAIQCAAMCIRFATELTPFPLQRDNH